MPGAAAMAATPDDGAPDRVTTGEIETAIRAAMSLPVVSVVFFDEGAEIGIAANLDTRSLQGAEDRTMHVKFSVEKLHRVNASTRPSRPHGARPRLHRDPMTPQDKRRERFCGFVRPRAVSRSSFWRSGRDAVEGAARGAEFAAEAHCFT